MTSAGGDTYSVTLDIPGDLPAGEYPLSVSAEYVAVRVPAATITDVGSLLVRETAGGQVQDAVTGLPLAGAQLSAFWVPGWRPRSSSMDTRLNTCESVASKEPGAWSQAAPADLGLLPEPTLAATPTFSPALPFQHTGADGRYLWQVAPDACWYVVARAPGYEPAVSPVVGGPDVAGLSLALQPLAPATCATPVTIAHNGASLSLAWAGGSGQQVWHGPLPYFTPGEAGPAGTFVADGAYGSLLPQSAPFSRYYRVVPATDGGAPACGPLGVFAFPLNAP